MFDIFKNMQKKESPFKNPQTTKQIAKALRGGKTDKEWFEYLNDIGKRNVEILNKLAEYGGLEGVEFIVTHVKDDL